MNVAEKMQAAFESKPQPHVIMVETEVVASAPGTKRDAEKVIEAAREAGDVLAERMTIRYVVCVPSASMIVGDVPLEEPRRRELSERGMREADIPDHRPLTEEEARYLVDVARDMKLPDAGRMWVEPRPVL